MLNDVGANVAADEEVRDAPKRPLLQDPYLNRIVELRHWAPLCAAFIRAKGHNIIEESMEILPELTENAAKNYIYYTLEGSNKRARISVDSFTAELRKTYDFGRLGLQDFSSQPASASEPGPQ